MPFLRKRRSRRPSKKKEEWKPPPLAKGEKITLKKMPPAARAVFKRFSQIFGIPVGEVAPEYSRATESPLSGTFDTIHGRIEFKPRKSSINHELFHCLGNLLQRLNYAQRISLKKFQEMEKLRKEIGGKEFGKSEFGRFRGKRHLFSEHVADFDRRLFWHLCKGNPFNIKLIIAGGLSVPLILINEKLAFASSGLLLSSMVFPVFKKYMIYHYFKKHGPDGLILLVVNPPKEFQLKRIKSWEREMIKSGYLQKKGGMTKKGLQLVRTLQPREAILERARGWREVQAAMREQGRL